MKKLFQGILTLAFVTALAIVPTMTNANVFSTESETQETINPDPAPQNEYLLIFRAPNMGDYQPTQEEIAAIIQQWGTWIGGIAKTGKLVRTHEVGQESAVVDAAANVHPGKEAFSQVKEVTSGYMIVKAETLKEATSLAKGCPVLAYGGDVVVYSVIQH